MGCDGVSGKSAINVRGEGGGGGFPSRLTQEGQWPFLEKKEREFRGCAWFLR